MTWLHVEQPSLLASAGRWPVEWWLLYTDTHRKHWWNRWLKPGFRHVQALRRDGRVWVAFEPHTEFLDVHIIRSDETPWDILPHATVQRVVVLREEGRMRSKFHLGPITCVEMVKALLGIRTPLVRTPWQLFNYCKGA